MRQLCAHLLLSSAAFLLCFCVLSCSVSLCFFVCLCACFPALFLCVSVYVGLGARQARILSEGARHGCNDALMALRAVRVLRPLHSYRCLKCGRTHLCGYEAAAVSISCFHLSIYPSVYICNCLQGTREGRRERRATRLHMPQVPSNPGAYTAPPCIALCMHTMRRCIQCIHRTSLHSSPRLHLPTLPSLRTKLSHSDTQKAQQCK